MILKTPPHAAVSATVGALDGHRASGLVNAVLRRLSVEGEPSIDDAPLHEIWSHPETLSERWISRFGRENAERLMEWNNSVPTLGACISDGYDLMEKGLFLDDYRVFPRSGGNPIKILPENYYIQDEATAIVARCAAELVEGGTVLEIGAAPGGKTHHLWNAAEFVVAMDSSSPRMLMWMENSIRLGWKRCFPVLADAFNIPFSRKFDLVFIDAPCSNTGVYRRRYDAKWKWSEMLLEQCVTSQRHLLRSSIDVVAPGGILIYSTCSLETEENLEQVDWFESIAPDFHRIRLPAPDMLVKDDHISIFPPEHGIDGIFAAAWRRNQ